MAKTRYVTREVNDVPGFLRPIHVGVGLNGGSGGIPLEEFSAEFLEGLKFGSYAMYPLAMKDGETQHRAITSYSNNRPEAEWVFHTIYGSLVPAEEDVLMRYLDLIEKQLKGGRHET